MLFTPNCFYRVFQSTVLCALSVALICLMDRTAYGQGAYLSAAGPVNRSMGGASTAAPLDPLGALYWNPATISGLKSSGLEIGMDLLYANQRLSSSVGPFSGSTESENGFFPIPNIGWVHKTENEAVTFGLGLNAIAGFKTNLLSNPSNPVLAPPPFGLGRVSSEASFLQIAPAVSVAVSETLSFGFGPTITAGEVGVEPFVFASPNANGHYSPARATRYQWGGGAQVGFYYIPNDQWHFGASLKTPQWMEPFRFFGEDATGAPRTVRLNIDVPLILSFGTAYNGFEKWTLAADVRYFDYHNASGFGDPAVFDGTGALGGLGWRSVVAVALGAQKKVSETIDLRAGYTFNQSPIKNDGAFFNVATPLFYQHMLSCGGTYHLSEAVGFNAAYSYFLPEELVGPIVLPGVGPVPGSSVHNRMDAHILSFGLNVKY